MYKRQRLNLAATDGHDRYRMKISFGVTRFLALSVGALLSVAAFAADTISGKVVGVADGDTITVLVAGHDQVKIRLANIDAPEKAQPFGQRSKQAMSDLAFGKAVECNQSGLDRYGRTIAVCMVGGVDINLAMVKAGICLLYTSPSPRDRTRSRMPSSACKKKITHHDTLLHIHLVMHKLTTMRYVYEIAL